ncbi:TonB-dependent receptor plug domain-containing protein [Hyphococcus sp. DH-69]|uniref:TonB-dependent receptor plug domain-containing protein n=1 Tax=Hyphococcus formosus TaxID=3143534 RepID=UPI00398B6A72
MLTKAANKSGWAALALRYFTVPCLVLATVSYVDSASAQDASLQYEFDIEEDQLGPALKKFADQTGFLALYPFEFADETGINPVIGTYTVEDALQILLRDVEFSGGLTTSGVITISRAAEKSASQEGQLNKKSLLTKLAGGVSSVVIGFTGAGTAAAQTDDNNSGDTIVVTGSRITNSNITSSSSVTVLGADEVDTRGILRVEDLINVLPQAYSGQSSTTGVNGAQATVNLRGLGAVRTLVLVDDRRLPYGSPINAAVDLNQIPSQLIDRVEVLTGGATAVYGSDAVAGVVNFIMKRDFEGVEASFQGSFYQADNNNAAVESVLADYNQADPGSVVDGGTYDFNLVAGSNIADGRGNVTAYFGYSRDNAIRWEDRDITACPFGTRNGGTDFSCSGSNSQPANTRYSRTGVGGFNLAVDQDTGMLRNYDSATDAFNFALGNYLQRPRERFTYGAFTRYDIADNVEFFFDFSGADNTTTAQIAGGGVSLGQTSTINCDNPLLTSEMQNVFCDPAVVFTDADGVQRAPLNVGRRNVEFPRNVEYNLNTQRFVGGFRGEVMEGIDYEVFGQFSKVSYTELFLNDVSLSKVAKAIDIVADPLSGDITCRSVVTGEDPDCVPFDIFTGAPITDAAGSYISTPALRIGDTSQLVFGGSLSGGLDRWGIVSPFATDGVQVAAGFEYRQDSLSLTPDDSDTTTNTRVPVDGTVSVYEFFGEMQVPVLQDLPFAEELTLSSAYRFSDYYQTTGAQHTYSVGVAWQPVPDIRLRAQYQRATRSPNPIELFNPQEFGLETLSGGSNGLNDPCAGDFDPATSVPEPLRSFEECARTGVTSAQYGTILDSAGNIFTLVGGNEDLDPETSNTWTAGVVLSPNAVPGLLVSVDYFSIDVEGFIGTVNANDALGQCLDTADPNFCGLINRDSAGTLFLIPGEAYIQGTNINTGNLTTSGFDVNASYSFDLADLGLGNAGDIRLGYIATFLSELSEQSLPGNPAIDCAGFHGGACDNPSPEYRHRVNLGWGLGSLSTTLSWRYLSSVEEYSTSPTEVNFLDATSYFDLSMQYELSNGVELRAGVNNILDQDPPLTSLAGFGGGEDAGRGNTYPQIYDAQGRYVFAGATVRF